ncbi:MAG: ferredoxin [Erysipelotrichaceae bacterium]|nr:ferredoxin [Erysipelotrichaceae bacterium]
MAKAKVIKGNCIGCGMCTSICPEVFEFDDDGLSKNKLGDNTELDPSVVPAVKESADSCPGLAIVVEE